MKARFALLCAIASVFCFVGSALAVPEGIPTPEPATMGLLAAGIAGVAILRKKFKK